MSEMISKPYLLDADAAKAYNAAVEGPPRIHPRENIHTDNTAARKAGFRAPIAGGEQTYAVMANFILDTFGADFLRGGRLQAALIKPVFYGDTLTMHARTFEDSAAQIQLEVWTENQLGERVLAGTARVPKKNS
jgi:acyl dehydratase